MKSIIGKYRSRINEKIIEIYKTNGGMRWKIFDDPTSFRGPFSIDIVENRYSYTSDLFFELNTTNELVLFDKGIKEEFCKID